MECGVVVPVAKGAIVVLGRVIQDPSVKEALRVSVLMLWKPTILGTRMEIVK